MSISGNIQELSVVDLLQYIHASGKSGILVVRRDDEEAKVFFQSGQIIRASYPGMRNLGNILVESFDLSRQDLMNAVKIQKSQAAEKPLGKILIETNTVNHSTLREAMFRQIEETMVHIVAWETGAFRFKVTDSKAPDGILAAPDDLLLPEEANTQLILLDAVRKFDEEKERPALEVIQGDIADEKAVSSVVLEGELGLSLPLLKMMLREVGDKMKGRDITLEFLNILSEHTRRAVLFVKKGSQLVGIGGFGKTKDGQSLRQEAKHCKLSLDSATLPRNQMGVGALYYGSPPKECWVDELYEKLGGPAHSNILLFPVAGVEQFICLVYADNGKDAQPIKNLDLIEVAAGQIGLIIENRFLRKKLQRFRKREPGNRI